MINQCIRNSYCSYGAVSPRSLREGVQFLVEGGIEVDAYSHLPITLDELDKILYQDFRAQGKYVFVNESLYNVLQDIINVDTIICVCV